MKSCNKVYSPDGCDSVDGQDVPEYIDSNGNPCDPSAPFDSNNPCELNRLYQEPVVQPQPKNYPQPQCIDLYGIANKKNWHQCFGQWAYYP